MPLKGDPKKGGTEADGSLSLDYCSYCYEGGRFKVPDATLPQMQEKVRQIMTDMKFSPSLTERTVRYLPRLKRWRGATS